MNETGHYGTELFTEVAERIIDTHNKSEPLFLYLAQQAVHSANEQDPLQAPQRLLDVSQSDNTAAIEFLIYIYNAVVAVDVVERLLSNSKSQLNSFEPGRCCSLGSRLLIFTIDTFQKFVTVTFENVC